MLTVSPIVLPNDQHVKHCQPDTVAYLRNRSLGPGTLYIASDRYPLT